MVSNSFKYASPEEYADKRIRVEARITDDRIGMAFEDNGIGLPMGFSLEEAESIWLSIVLSIIKKELEVELAFHSGPGAGTCADIRAPKERIYLGGLY